MIFACCRLVRSSVSLSIFARGALPFRHVVFYARGRSLKRAGLLLQSSPQNNDMSMGEGEGEKEGESEGESESEESPITFSPPQPVNVPKKAIEKVEHSRKNISLGKPDRVDQGTGAAARRPYSPHVIELAEKLIQQGKFGKAPLSFSPPPSSSSPSYKKTFNTREPFRAKQSSYENEHSSQDKKGPKKFQGFTPKTYYHKPGMESRAASSNWSESRDVKSPRTFGSFDAKSQRDSRPVEPKPWSRGASHSQYDSKSFQQGSGSHTRTTFHDQDRSPTYDRLPSSHTKSRTDAYAERLNQRPDTKYSHQYQSPSQRPPFAKRTSVMATHETAESQKPSIQFHKKKSMGSTIQHVQSRYSR